MTVRRDFGEWSAEHAQAGRTGTTIQNALNAAAASGVTAVVVPEGDWDCSDVPRISIPDGIRQFRGVGPATRLMFAPRNADGQNIVANTLTSPQRAFLRVSDMEINGGTDGLPTDGTPLGVSLRINNYAEAEVENVTIRNVEGFAYLFEDCLTVNGDTVKVFGSGRDGFHVAGECLRATLNNYTAISVGDDCVIFSNRKDVPDNTEASLTNFVLDPNAHGDNVNNKASGVLVDGFKQVSITGGTITNPVWNGVHVRHSDGPTNPVGTEGRPRNVVIDDVVVRQVGNWGVTPARVGDAIHAGFAVKNADFVTIGPGCHVEGARDHGVYLVDCDRVRVMASVTESGLLSTDPIAPAIYAVDCGRVHVQAAQVTDNASTGVRSNAGELVIDACYIDGNGTQQPNAQGSGVFHSGDKLVVRSSQITRNAGWGVRTVTMSESNIQDNDITSNGLGAIGHSVPPTFEVESGNVETVGVQPTSTY